MTNLQSAINWSTDLLFSVNADVQIEGSDRRGAQRLIRYCARPAFSGEKLTLISEKPKALIAHGYSMM